MTQPISVDELRSIAEYEKVRDDLRARVIALKKYRRVPIGDRITFVFENRETMLFQIHEMMRAEGLHSREALQNECDVYNALLPSAGELSATMFVELKESANIAAELQRLVGVDEHVALMIGDTVIPAKFEHGRSTEEKISTVQYVRFSLDTRQRQRLADAKLRVLLRIDHPAYRAAADLGPETRRSLVEDLT